MISSAIILLICAGTIYCQSVTLPPANKTQVIGGTAQFECEVDFESVPRFNWEFNGIILYAYHSGSEDYPNGADRYMATKEENRFTLMVKNVAFEDAGLYTCSVTVESRIAVLIVLDMPYLLSNPPITMEGDTVTYTCNARFGGPKKDVISKSHYPRLAMYFNGNRVKVSSLEIQSGDEVIHYHLKQEYSVKLEENMHGHPVLCEISTALPQDHANVSLIIHVWYPVRDISYTPKYERYEVGMVIICTAEGNPYPTFQWEDVNDLEKVIPNQWLEVTEAMIGQNSWRCTANNTINNKLHDQAVIVSFEAVKTSSDSWKIALGVVVPLLVCCAIISTFIYKVLRKNGKNYSKIVNKDGGSDNHMPAPNNNDSSYKMNILHPDENVIQVSPKNEESKNANNASPKQGDVQRSSEGQCCFSYELKTGNFKEVKQMMKDFILDDEVYKEIVKRLKREMEKGLSKERHETTDLKMLPTYVRSLPDKKESGNFLAVQFSGRIIHTTLVTFEASHEGNESKSHINDEKQKVHPVSATMETDPEEKFFDQMADCIAKCVAGKIGSKLKGKLPLGLSFHFPLQQKAIDAGILERWTKGLTTKGIVGKDVMKLLREAIERKGEILSNVECVVIVNNITDCLMRCAFDEQNCEIAVVLGHGTNACYMEKLEKVETWNGDKDDPKQVVINTEWGAFGDSSDVLDFVRTSIDKTVDEGSTNPRKQFFEKMMAGEHLGEILRLCIMEAINQTLIFKDVAPAKLSEKGSVTTSVMLEIEGETDISKFPKTQSILDSLGCEDATIEDCRYVHFISDIISQRAAYLASAGIATLINRIGKPGVTMTVAICGMVYDGHPKLYSLMNKKISELINPGLKFQLKSPKYKKGTGAAIAAAVEVKNKGRRFHLNSTDLL